MEQYSLEKMQSMDNESLDAYLTSVQKKENICFGPFAVIWANGTKILKERFGIV